MVVNRKTPAAPAPPASRSNSSQPLPRAVKTKNVPPSVPIPVTVTSSHDKPSKSKQKQQKRKETLEKGASITQRLFVLLLGVFSLYAATICRTDHPRTSPICRSLDTYRTHIVDPYILPPIHTLAHRAAPHVAPLKPYLAPAAEFTRSHIMPRATALASFTDQQYKTRVVPAYHRYIVPAYKHYVVHEFYGGIVKPIYVKGIYPHLYPHVQPYILAYHKYIVPFAQRTYQHIDATYRHIRPHVLHYAAQARSAAWSAYRTAEPYAIQAWDYVRPHLAVPWERVKVQILQLAKIAGDARREYVDPHVRRIWDKVIEAEVVSSFNPSSTPTEPTQATADEPTSPLYDDPAPSSVSTTPAVVAEPPAADSETPAVTLTPEEETPSITPATLIVEAVLPSSPSPVPPTEEASAAAESIVAASLHPDFVGVAATDVPSPSPVSEESKDEGMDDFLKDIGLEEQIPGSAPQVSEPEPEPESNAEELTGPTPEQRLAETAAKRAEITKRHAAWQAELDALVDEMRARVENGVRTVREAAVVELSTGKANGVIKDVESEAGRLVKGLEGYLKQVNDGGEKEREKWRKVLEKVEEKFAEKVKDVQRDVHGWYLEVREKEVDEVNNATAAVKSLAERAQGDIGLDYAWLEDVTFHDWQRYHDLMRTSENFTAVASFLQSGDRTHLKAPLETLEAVEDKVVEALNELEHEVNDVVEGFGSLLRSVRRKAAEGVFAEAEAEAGEEEAKEEEVPRVSILPITPTPPKGEKESEVGDETKEEEEPRVSILPITPIPPKGEKEREVVDVDHLFVGRGKEEVEANLKEVPLESERTVKDEL